jgi:nitrogen fixation/metabolism regulation signal transduction histidine kinase
VNAGGYALIGLTAVVAVLASILTFAVLRFMSAARAITRPERRISSENALLSAALEESVTRLKAKERAMAARADASERLSSEIISSLAAGLMVVGLKGDVQIINPAGRRLLCVPEDASPDDYRRLIGEPALSKVIDECLSTGVAVVRRTVHMSDRREGATRLGVTVSPLFDEKGKLHGAVCLFSDLTAVQQLEEQLRLKESLATVGELTAGIAHEFRNGLATIHGYGKLLDPAALPQVYRPYVEGIRAETESLGEIVTNFLNFARPAQLTLSDVDLRAVCERVAEEVRPEARGLGGDVTLRGSFGKLQGDEVLLRQAFSNLLRNAVEACSQSSIPPTVVVASEVDQERGIANITVDDNGPGIDPAARERVFQPFFTSKRGGTGLGLALVQKIVVFHNGRITAGSSNLGGASLRVTLPIS